MAFLQPVVGCLVKKGLQKGGSRAPQDPPGYALVLIERTDCHDLIIRAGVKNSLHIRVMANSHI